MPNQILPLTSHDLLEDIQINQALLKTILKNLENSSADPEQAQKDNAKIYLDFLEEIKLAHHVRKQIKQ